MTLGPPPPSKVEDPPLDPGGLSSRKSDEGLEGANIFNNQMGPIGQSVPFFMSFMYYIANIHQVIVRHRAARFWGGKI